MFLPQGQHLECCVLQAAQSIWKQVTEFSPQQQGLSVKNINILLCGGVGAGKSSIVCTLDSMCKGRKSDRASHGQGTGSLSRHLRKYSFKDPKSKQPLHWQLWDTMGWGVKDYKRGELEFILDGNLPDRCKLDEQITFKTPGYNRNPGPGDKVHCVCFVVPCSSATDESYMSRLCELRDVVRSRGIICLFIPCTSCQKLFATLLSLQSCCFRHLFDHEIGCCMLAYVALRDLANQATKVPVSCLVHAKLVRNSPQRAFASDSNVVSTCGSHAECLAFQSLLCHTDIQISI